MNECIQLSDGSTQRCRSRQPNKAFTSCRTTAKSIEYHTPGVPLHSDVILRFIEVSPPPQPNLYALVPFVWTKILKKSTSILKAQWPSAVEVATDAIEQHEHIINLVSSWRKSLSAEAKRAAKKNKGKKEAVKAPNAAIIFYQQTYPAWRLEVHRFLKAEFEGNRQTLPSDAVRRLGAHIKETPLLAEQGKSLMKKVAHIMEVNAKGISTLSDNFRFNELEVLNESVPYVSSSEARSDFAGR